MEQLKTYTPSEIETKWYDIWESSGYFKPTYKEGADNYCIQMPPPNVTGTLHMGHGFQHTLQDALIRYHRMKGYNTLWQPGTDHAGIATQIVVERNLEADGINRKDIGREEFIKRVWEWKDYSGNVITKQIRRLGSSCDWSRERFTMDTGLSQAVIEVFVSLYEKGYIYRGYRLVNWDVRRQTAVSDLEVKSVEEQGHLWHFKYPVKDSDEFIVIATTRPETMLGDMAVAVNPTDERYKHLIGKILVLPLVGREIPIIADDYVDVEFGTGCVKITPAHDFNDYEIGKRHNLEMISIMSLDGHINSNAPLKYRCLERYRARKEIVADMDALGLLVEVKSHKLMVPHGEKDDVVLEPMLTHQWFMKMDKFAQKGLELVKNGEVKFVPENWQVIYNQWLENIQDWCISRQLWWGHRIPAYFDDNGKFYVAHSLKDAIKQAGTDKLTQESDVLDTWFSAALWCFSTLGWPHKTLELNEFLPSSVLVTGFDIIFFWVARMIMMTSEFTGKVPFKDVYITGLIQDSQGNKMSKSKGNIIDPLDLINGIGLDDLVTKRTQHLMNPKQKDSIKKQTIKDYPNGFMSFGADALRFTFAAIATNGHEIRFDIKRIEGSRNFCNKIWNATRFVLMNVKPYPELINKPLKLGLIDKWILGSLTKLISEVDLAYKTYRFDILVQKIYEFIWNDYCDWYLELAKVNLASSNIEEKTATLNTLLKVLECVLRIIHPIMPFITEELWQEVAPICNKKVVNSIMIADYPTVEEIGIVEDKVIIKQINLLKDVVVAVRNLRAEMGISPAVKVPLKMELRDELLFAEEHINYLNILAKVSDCEVVNQLVDGIAPIAIIQGIRISLDIKIDKEVEKARILREIEKINKELVKIQVKLDNPSFVSRAPKELIERDTLKVRELSGKITHFEEQLNVLISDN